MTNPRSLALFALLLALSTSLACSQSSAASGAGAPPTPTMPTQWRVLSDFDFAPADIRGVAAKLGAEISALRNTTYEVGGMQVKLNTIVAATPGDADSIIRALGKMKSEEWVLRRDLVIYEFVGSNAAIPEMRKGRAILIGH